MKEARTVILPRVVPCAFGLWYLSKDEVEFVGIDQYRWEDVPKDVMEVLTDRFKLHFSKQTYGGEC